MTDEELEQYGFGEQIDDPDFVPLGNAYYRTKNAVGFDATRAVQEMFDARQLTIRPVRAKDGTLIAAIYLYCPDTFYWGGSDQELLPAKMIREAYDLFKSADRYALTKLCCRLRHLQPQIPLREQMKEKGAWEAWLGDLPEPKDHPDAPD